MTIRTSHLGALRLVPNANTDTTIYTVPAGVRTLVKTVNVFAGTAGTYFVGYTPSGGLHRAIMAGTIAAANTSVVVALGLVLDAGDVLKCAYTVANTANFDASGIVFTL